MQQEVYFRFNGTSGNRRPLTSLRSEAMALPDLTLTLAASASFLSILYLCVRYKRSAQVFGRLLSKIMARTEKPLFRIA